MPTKLIGTLPSQVPLNAHLGSLAFEDRDNVNISGGAIALNASTTAGYMNNTDISEVKPSLLLDFANGKQLDPRISYSRGTIGTYYDGKTVAKAEENLALYSQQINDTNWSVAQANWIQNATIAPDGTQTASLLYESTSSSEHYSAKNIGSSGTTANYTASVFAKTCGRQYLIVNHNQSTGGTECWFDLVNGTVGTVGSGMTATITSAGNGWYRCVVTGSVNSAWQPGVQLYLATTNGSTSYAGNGSSGVYCWGIQYEQRSGASAYTPTTSQPITNYVPQLLTSPANTPRFDHDPYTGESKGLLIEEARTNLVTSSAYGDSYFSATSYSFLLPNQTIAPDGTLTASKLGVLGSAIGGNYQPRYQMINSPGGAGTWTLSCYAKAGEWNYLALAIFATSNYQTVTFNLSDSSVSNLSGLDSYSITPVGNGWYRCVITATTGGTINQNPTGLWPSFDGAVAGYNTGGWTAGMSNIINGYNGVYIWGIQFEQGNFATSYIPTNGAQVTRSGDTATMSGSNFSSWYQQSGGTFSFESAQISSKYPAGAHDALFGLIDAPTTNFVSIYNWNGNGYLYAYTYGTANLNSTFGTFSTPYKKRALGLSVNNVSLYENGQSVITDTSYPQPPEFVKLSIGSHPSGNLQINGWMKKLVYYPVRLTEAELAEMTL